MGMRGFYPSLIWVWLCYITGGALVASEEKLSKRSSIVSSYGLKRHLLWAGGGTVACCACYRLYQYYLSSDESTYDTKASMAWIQDELIHFDDISINQGLYNSIYELMKECSEEGHRFSVFFGSTRGEKRFFDKCMFILCRSKVDLEYTKYQVFKFISKDKKICYDIDMAKMVSLLQPVEHLPPMRLHMRTYVLLYKAFMHTRGVIGGARDMDGGDYRKGVKRYVKAHQLPIVHLFG